MLARRIDLFFRYENKDISADIAPFIESLSFTDNASGESDRFEMGLEDRAGLWENDWFPTKGAQMNADLIARNWRPGEDEIAYPLGKMEIDEFEFSGPPKKFKIKALSVYASGQIRETRSKGWENVTLKAILQEIAARHGLGALYEAAYNPVYDRRDQNEESDSTFLLKLCNDAGLCLKFTDGQIVIFDEEEYEKRAPLFTIENGASEVISFSFRTKNTEVFQAAKVTYRRGKKKQTITGEMKALDVDSTGKVLKIKKKVASGAEAERLAKKELRKKNRDQNTANFVIPWRPDAPAGCMVEVKGYGEFDGRYMIDQAQHTIRESGGSRISLDLHKKLEGY